jgi:hypothetical protein
MPHAIIKNRRVSLSTAPVAVRGEKTVELLEDEGVVHAIQLRCACGEITVIELEYGAAPAATAPPEARPSSPEGTSEENPS